MILVGYRLCRCPVASPLYIVHLDTLEFIHIMKNTKRLTMLLNQTPEEDPELHHRCR
jgi:hypothetical protein